MKRFGSFVVADDGTLSLHEQSKFHVYGPTGGLVCAIATFRLDGANVIETRTSTVNPQESKQFIYPCEDLLAACGWELKKAGA